MERFCARCQQPMIVPGAYCENCHKIVRQEMAERCDAPGGKIQTENEPGELVTTSSQGFDDNAYDKLRRQSHRVVKKSLDTPEADPDAFARAD